MLTKDQLILIPAFFCANNIESLVNNLFGVKSINPVPIFFHSPGFSNSFL